MGKGVTLKCCSEGGEGNGVASFDGAVGRSLNIGEFFEQEFAINVRELFFLPMSAGQQKRGEGCK